MANNLLWLKHIDSKQRVLLAKYYPSTGWYVSDTKGLVERLEILFEDGDDSQWGHNSFVLVYEDTCQELQKVLADGTLASPIVRLPKDEPRGPYEPNLLKKDK